MTPGTVLAAQGGRQDLKRRMSRVKDRLGDIEGNRHEKHGLRTAVQLASTELGIHGLRDAFSGWTRTIPTSTKRCKR